MKRALPNPSGTFSRDPMLESLLRDPAPERPISSVPPALPGERHRSLDEMAADLEALRRPIAKVTPERARRQALNAAALERFRFAIDELVNMGWSRDRIARHLGCAQTTVDDVYDGNRLVSAWMLDALPDVQVLIAQKRIEQLKKRAG